MIDKQDYLNLYSILSHYKKSIPKDLNDTISEEEVGQLLIDIKDQLVS